MQLWFHVTEQTERLHVMFGRIIEILSGINKQINWQLMNEAE